MTRVFNALLLQQGVVLLKINVRGKNVTVTDALREHVHKKLSKTERYFYTEPEATVALGVQRDRHIAEITLSINGMLLRAETATNDMYASIDAAVDKIERQIRKFKTRINRRSRRADGEKPLVALLDNEADEQDEPEPRIIRRKQFVMKPMDVEEAILQMNLLGHDFFVFRNADTNEISVVYKRQDGNYGLIEPSP